MEPSTAGGDVEVVDVAVAPSVGNDIDKVPVDDNGGEELVERDKIDLAAGKGTKMRKAEKIDPAQKRACKPKAKPGKFRFKPACTPKGDRSAREEVASKAVSLSLSWNHSLDWLLMSLMSPRLG